MHRGEVEAAAALQWDIYQHTQQLEDYRRLVALSSEHDLAVDYRQRACDWLSAQLDKPPEKPRAFAPRTVNSLLEIYLFEQRLPEALALATDRPVAPGLLLQLVRALGDPDVSRPSYKRLVHSLVRNTDNQSYRQAIALLQEHQRTLETTSQHRAFAEDLAQLRVEFKPKRNFIKWLNEAVEHSTSG